VFNVVIWPVFIGMIIGFIALHITITFRDRQKPFTMIRMPGFILAFAGVACILFGAINYTYIGKSTLFLGVALLVFAAMSMATTRTFHQT